MTQPKLVMLEDAMIDQIISEGIELLADPGIRIHNREVLLLLAEAGCKVNQTSMIACIPEQIVYQSLESAPSEFFLYDLEGKPVVHYGGDDIHFDPGSSGLSVLDWETGKQRPPVTRDLVRFVKLVEALPQIDAQSTAMVCSDVAEEIGDLYRLYLALVYMKKPIITGAFRKDTFWTMKELLTTAAGSEENLASRPIAVFDVCPSPPLWWSDTTSQNLIDCARSMIPAELVSMPLAGVAAPVTLAGAIVQHTAESMSGVVIHQIAKSGAPIVWGGSPAVFDMRTGAPPTGAVETWMIDAGYIQVGKRLGIPTHTYLGMSESKAIDVQCGLESMGGALIAALAGTNMISGAGMMDYETCLSEEKLVVDAEMIGMIKHLIKGIHVREQPLAVPLMREMGHKADYLVSPHTRKWFREEHYIPSPVINRMNYDAWIEQGSISANQRAHDRVEKLLQNYSPSPLPADVHHELRRITEKAARHFGIQILPDLPE